MSTHVAQQDALHNHLQDFLTQIDSQYPEHFNFHQALGAIVSCLSTPDTLTAADILDLILNGDENAAEAFLDSNPEREAAWLQVLQTITKTIKADESYLATLYPQTSAEPPPELAAWCDGYLQAFLYCEEIWREIFEYFKDEGDPSVSDIEENYSMLLHMISSFSNWKQALIAEPLLANISTQVAQIHADLFANVHYFFVVGQDMLAALTALPADPYVKTEHIGRNDPCSCGSGKKYKKCCLLKQH